MAYDAGTKKAISFCTSCRNRMWQISQTLGANLETLDEDLEIVLVDYGSTDGLAAWVWSNFAAAIESGRLVFFEVKNKVSWSSPRAKNLAHRLGRGDFLFNLDADNFVTKLDIMLLRRVRQLGLVTQQWSGVQEDGSYGRIGLPRKLFFKLGGYDETLLPMGGQDTDLINRMRVARLRFAKVPPPEKPAILNDYAHKVAEIGKAKAVDETKSKMLWETMDQLNFKLSIFRLRSEGPWRSDGFQTFEGKLNGKPVIIDGLNHIRAADGVKA